MTVARLVLWGIWQGVRPFKSGADVAGVSPVRRREGLSCAGLNPHTRARAVHTRTHAHTHSHTRAPAQTNSHRHTHARCMHALRRAHSLTGCLAPIGPNSLSSLLKSRRATCNRSHDLCDPKASPAGPARDAQERGCRTPSRYPAASSQSERKNRRPSSAASVVGSPTVTGGRQHCGKSRSAARVDRRESAWWDTCTLRIGAASDRPTNIGKLCHFHAPP